MLADNILEPATASEITSLLRLLHCLSSVLYVHLLILIALRTVNKKILGDGGYIAVYVLHSIVLLLLLNATHVMGSGVASTHISQDVTVLSIVFLLGTVFLGLTFWVGVYNDIERINRLKEYEYNKQNKREKLRYE